MARTPPFLSQTTASAPASGAVHHVATKEKVYAPTFDCCATCSKKFGVADNLINHVVQSGTNATFFLTGEWMIAHPSAARKIIAAKNIEVGFHGFSHSDFPLSSSDPKLLDHEINTTRRVFDTIVKDMAKKGEITPQLSRQRQAAHLFRFPSGNFDDASLAAVYRAGLTPIQWNATADNASSIQLAKGQKLEGSITLAHANMSKPVLGTNRSFPTLDSNMQQRGFQAVTVSELMRAGRVVYTKTPEHLSKHDHDVIARNQRENAAHGYGKKSAQRFIASLETQPAHYAQRNKPSPQSTY